MFTKLPEPTTHQEEFFKDLNGVLTVFAVLLCIYLVLFYLGGCFRDPTDAPGEPSGMRHHVDHETGVHYLSRGGVLIPRLRADGSIYVEEKED